MTRILAVFVLCGSLLTGGCATLIRDQLPRHPPRSLLAVDPLETAACLRPSASGLGYAQLEGPVVDPELLVHLVDVPRDVRRTAQAAGLEPILAQVLRARASAPDAAAASVVATRLEVVMRISSLEIQLATLLFEADCTGDQMEAVVTELDRRAGKRELAFTIASIAVGALLGVAAGVWDLKGNNEAGPPALGIAGGVATAGLGIAAFVPKRGRVLFPHEHNLFVPIVQGEDPDRLYPPFVFRLLTTSRPSQSRTPREQLLADWKHLIAGAIPAADRRLAESVLYGNGGIYDGDLVDVRERMFDVLESQLNAFDQDLELLYRYFGHLLDDPTLGAPRG